MRILNITLLGVYIFLTQSCVAQGTKEKGYSWLNIKYIKCMENRLPCECEEYTQGYFALSLDTNKYSKNYGIALSKFSQMEPYIYPIKEDGFNRYEIQLKKGSNDSWATIVIRNDTLSLVEKGGTSKFVRISKQKDFNRQQFTEDNVMLFNDALMKRGYPHIQEIVHEDSLRFDCNKWTGNANMLYVQGRPKAWIIDIVGDSMEINRVVNMDADPDEDLQTEKIAAYYWK